MIVKNVNHKLEEKIVYLEKTDEKGVIQPQKQRTNIRHTNQNLENTVVSTCKDSGVDIDPKDFEGCHRLPLSKNRRGQDKRVIVKFVNRKDSEALLRDKKQISSKCFNRFNVPNKVFVSVFLCSYYRYVWGRCKYLQNKDQVNHVFCLGGVVCIKLSENGSPIKLYHMTDILDFHSESSIENQIVNMVILLDIL